MLRALESRKPRGTVFVGIKYIAERIKLFQDFLSEAMFAVLPGTLRFLSIFGKLNFADGIAKVEEALV